MNPTNKVMARLRGGIIVSCQPVVGGPMDSTHIVTQQCLAAEAGGASGLRVEGIERVRSTASVSSLPIIGITKRTLPNTGVCITPFLDDVEALIAAGAEIIALDATQRLRPTSTADTIRRIHDLGGLAMADCATISDARQAVSEGADILASTLSGYAYDIVPEDTPPDFNLLKEMSMLGSFVVAEGRIRQPRDARTAIDCGADAVVVGSAITRIEYVTNWFSQIIQSTSSCHNNHYE